MKTMIFTLLLLLGLPVHSYARSQQDLKKIESGTDVEQMASQEQLYLFQNFEDGVVIKKNGAFARGKLNYNLVVGQMQFIDPATEERLALADIATVATVSISGRSFIPLSARGEFLEILVDGANSLGVKRRTITRTYGKEGAYGVIHTSASIESVQTLPLSERPAEAFSVSNYQLISSQSLFYLVTNGKRKLIQNKKTILNAYPKSVRPQIDQYISDSNIDLRNEQELITLINFCNLL